MEQQGTVGKPRSFVRGFLLSAVTLGLYGIYWNYTAHDEVFRQLDLRSKGREMNTIWLIVGLFIPPVLWYYQYKFVENVNVAREELGLGEEVTPAEFLLWGILGAFILIGPFVAYYKLQGTINGIWHEVEAQDEGSQGTGGLEASAPEKATA